MVILMGGIYLLIGILFGALAGAAASHQMVVTWRLAAFALSAIVFGCHIGYEHFRRRNAPLTIAWHTGMAVALGAFGLAAAANIHAFSVATSNRRGLAVALLAWPLLCGVPAFVVAFAAATGAARLLRHNERSTRG